MASLRSLPLIAVLCSLAGACAPSGSFPSLAPRPEELRRADQAVQAPAPAPARPLDPAVVSRISSLLADARRGDSAFQAVLPQTERAIAASGAAGSDNWVQAQQALSRLEAARSPTTVAAADLDALARAQGEASPNAPQFGAIGTAIEQVDRLIESQDQVIGRLNQALPTL